MTIILVDMDSTITDIEGGFLRKWAQLFPNEYYIALKDRTTIKIEDQYPKELQEKVSSIFKLQAIIRCIWA